jgi:hypothetical protein
MVAVSLLWDYQRVQFLKEFVRIYNTYGQLITGKGHLTIVNITSRAAVHSSACLRDRILVPAA